jgi:hypothetical protein
MRLTSKNPASEAVRRERLHVAPNKRLTIDLDQPAMDCRD